jgi:murein DD-endopeptidase MepM/ murein hydrolase activator NlpD
MTQDKGRKAPDRAVRLEAIRRRQRLMCVLMAGLLLCAFGGMLVLRAFLQEQRILETLSAEEYEAYESEVSQFLYDDTDEMLITLAVGEPIQEQELVEEAVYAALAEQEGQPEDDTIALAEAQEGSYPVLMVDGALIGALQSAEDALWLQEKLMERHQEAPFGGTIKKRIFESRLEVLYQSEEPETVFSREELFLRLSELVKVRIIEQVSVTETLNYATQYIEDDSLYEGKTSTVRKGQNGKKRTVYEITSLDGKEISRDQIGETEIVQQTVDKIVARGTKKVTQSVSVSGIPEESSSSSGNVKNPASGATYGCESPGSYYTKTSGSIKTFSGSSVGMGEYYPNIDQSREKPTSDEGILGPNPGGLSFAWPVTGKGRSNISSYFGWRWGRMHYGVDFPADTGVKILASEDGTVTSYTGTHSGYGLIVEISHSGGFTTRYAHCSKILVEEGQRVSKGEVIALVGSTGTSSSGPHCHYEIRADGVPYNPLFYLK